ncbi:MAG: bifunctional histidinol-phosphatase/imidazoleglycerol-phosphate dehydratase HisB [Bacteroidota bacterium]|nr:bifunctional histidinol-phosphatase/imidazoleglycerol-phosphate dehydratase HisB [Bacteroidota bacterium]
MKKLLFIDRDGTLILEPFDFQVDSIEKLTFYPGMFRYLGQIARWLNYELVMVTNQDGLGTESYPEENFQPIHDLIMRTLANEGIHFSAVHIDRSFPEEKASTRKPELGMLTEYLNGDIDIAHSYVIGDRITDVQLAANLGCKAIRLLPPDQSGLGAEIPDALKPVIVLETQSWEDVWKYMAGKMRKAEIIRKTKETDIHISLNLDGGGKSAINTGLKFFDHMLEQIAMHGGIELNITVNGDLAVDEHHTVEDTALALGKAFSQAIGDKKGMGRYGFCLPMDDCLAQAAIDFGGRPWLVWKVKFKREYIGDVPTEMFYHFFKSFSDAAQVNLNIQAKGDNEHHKIESVFKSVARAIRMAIKVDFENAGLPSTKGML